ncbi:hypothetical protein tinsulaeT_16510 [Thalassotalea insulae]|uniref:Tetratricopeptide repeat protein n=2 Tax=Thalassotalea insulae TaxID=2056778 RepID=A0ABQ6GQY2_9GAMM|nr:hypothetical protein tinsulaeT_16510 [Thalassotalea insulae]
MWLICYPISANEKVDTPKSALHKISSVCLTSPFDCLENIDSTIEMVPPKSRVYFQILQYKYEALLNLQHMERLYNETKYWLNQPELPFLFQISNAIYFAKAALRMGDQQGSITSYRFAKSLLGQMNNEYPSPLRLVQFANLQMQLSEFQQAYKLLLSLKQKYPKSPDIHFMLELNGNLGHAANQLGKTEQALTHWQESVKWAEQFGNKQQLAVVLFNLADIYEQLQQYPQAQQNFTESVKVAYQAGDKIKANQANYHLVRVLAKQHRFCQALALYRTLDKEILPSKPIYPFNDLPQILTNCTTAQKVN